MGSLGHQSMVSPMLSAVLLRQLYGVSVKLMALYTCVCSAKFRMRACGDQPSQSVATPPDEFQQVMWPLACGKVPIALS